MKKKIIGKLTEGQFDLFLRQQKCKEASKWLIREILHEVEKADVYLERIWRKIHNEFGNNLTPEELTKIQLSDTGEVYYIDDRDGEPATDLNLKKLDIAWENAKGE